MFAAVGCFRFVFFFFFLLLLLLLLQLMPTWWK
jgi:hypothetical protein